MATVIATSALTKRFGRNRAVEDVDLSVEQGEIHGLLGPNGAGKSTAIRLLLGLIRPTGGSARILGRDCWLERRAIHRSIGMLPSDFTYEESLTGRQVIEFFVGLRGATRQGVRRAEQLAERLRADLDRPQRQLSRGNRQKIGLIQALAHDPDLLLLDEPTGGLDPLMQEEFLRLIAELRERGRTVLLSSHNMSEVERACDRVSMIHQGRLMAVETVESMLAAAPKHVRAVLAARPDLQALSRLPGVSSVTAAENVIELDVTGEIDAVLRELTAHRVLDLTCQRPSLESAFVGLYEKDAA